MAIKHEILKILERNRGTAVSGGALADEFGVSRTAVWKAVGALKSEGYPIEGTPRRGYVLSDSSSLLSGEAVAAGLSAMGFEAPAGPVLVFRSIDSTNAEAKRRVAEAPSLSDIPYGAVIIADEQTAGRGRRGRAFHSPAADSVYMSFVLKPAAAVENSLLITIMAAVAVCRAIERVTGVADGASGSHDESAPGGGSDAQRPRIKWVNDIYINEKKICGILTEAVSDVESGTIESLVLGIGVNINVPAADFPVKIRDIAGSLRIEPGRRSLFAAALIGEVFSLYSRLTEAAYIMREYRERSLMEDREITVFRGGESTEAVSRGVADDGTLLVEYTDGTMENLRSGEVSIGIGGRGSP